MHPLVAHEPAVRLGVFLGVMALLLVAEAAFPARSRVATRVARWPHNLALVGVGTLVVRLVAPVAPVALAAIVTERGIGLLPALGVSGVPAVVLAVLLLDLVIWAQHLVFHAVPAFWRLHRVHHADPDLDVTSALRFHPLELLLSLGVKLVAVAALGAPALGVLLFEIVLNAGAMFTHADVRLPPRLDRALRKLLITPSAHRIHHSVVPAETHSNFGFHLSCWDRLFGTWREPGDDGSVAVRLGVPGLEDPAELRLDRLLTQPFRRPGGPEAAPVRRAG